MSLNIKKFEDTTEQITTSLECDFPIVKISQLAEQESWRKEINRPIYHIHKWWATRLGSVFRGIALAALSTPETDIWKSFYNSHKLTNKIVLDPFMGSGTTIGEVVKLGAKAIGCDINPVSTFLVRQEFTRVSEKQLRAAFVQLEQKIAPEIRHYYQTRDPQSGNLIPVLYFFWVKIIKTPEGEDIPLFTSYVFSKDAYPKKKPNAHVVCPNCWEIFEARYDSTNLSCPHCSENFNPQIGTSFGQNVKTKDGKQYRIKDLIPVDGTPLSHRMYAIMALRPTGEKIYLPTRDEDLSLYSEAENRLQHESLPLPTLAVRSGHNTDQALGYNYMHWKDFFNSRQLLCLGLLLKSIKGIEDEAIKEQLLCLFSSTLEFNNLFCSFKGEGTGAVRHMFYNHILKPERTPIENSIWGTIKSSGTFSTLFESRLIPAKRYLDEPFEINVRFDKNDNLLGSEKIIASPPINVKLVESWQQLQSTPNGIFILNGDSSKLPLPDSVVDAVITDPPYFDFIHYSELSDFFFAWLSPVLKSSYQYFTKSNSFDIGEVQNIDPFVFASQLSLVFSECSRVLKDEGVLTFSFHHSKPEGWAAICKAIINSGFCVVAAHPVHAELRVSSQKTSTKDPISLDAILVCKKQNQVKPLLFDEPSIIKKSDELVKKLIGAGMNLSSADYFVVLAAQMLIPLSTQKNDFESICNILQRSKNTILNHFQQIS